MRKKEYKNVINSVIDLLIDQLVGDNKRELIGSVFRYIDENDLIPDYNKTSLYNTIYYFLRKRGILKVVDVQHRFDSIDSKIKFLDDVRNDLSDRWWFYSELFFGDSGIPTVESSIKLKSGTVNYIIDSRENETLDFLYTLLYFRDLRKLLSSDMETVFLKRELNRDLYSIISSLYDLENTAKTWALDLNEGHRHGLLSMITEFYGFLSVFDTDDYKKFLSSMVKQISAFRKFVVITGDKRILSFNKTRFFDSITFLNVVYLSALAALDPKLYSSFSNIHYLVNSTTYYIFFKFARRLKGNHFDKLVDYFDSDFYFSYSKYIINYYSLFQTDARKLIEIAGGDKDSVFSFDIFLRYMLYNKFRNLINANIKRFISIDFNVTEGSFLDVDELKDNVFFEHQIYSGSDPCEDITTQKFVTLCDTFFKDTDDGTRLNITNAAIDLCYGHKNKRHDKTISSASKKLVTTLQGALR